MPMAIPLIAAAATASAGVAAFAAATTMVGMITAGMMVAGAAMTAIGTLTGNKNLTKWGGIVSLAGGVGNILSGAASSTASAVGEASTGATDAASNASSGLSGSSTTGATGGAESALTGTEAVTPVVGGEQAAAVAGEAATPALAGEGQGLIAGQMTTPAGAAELATPAVDTTITGAAEAAAPVQGADAVAAANPTPVNAPTRAEELLAGYTERTPTALESLQNMGSKAAQFAKGNKELVQAGAGLVQGAMQQKAQGDMLDERMRLEEEAVARQRARLNASVMGLRMPTYQRKVSPQ
jgi:hypothetical protein